MAANIEYDVFLSFASIDEEFVKPIWQELSSSGLRVFWSDQTLKQNIGQSFFAVIQNALTESRHFVLICTPNSMKSHWVIEEYETFFSQCYIPSGRQRRLIIFEGVGFNRSLLPTLLKNIQSTSSVEEVVSILGGVNVQVLKNENKELKQKIQTAYSEIDSLKNELANSINANYNLRQSFSTYEAQIEVLKNKGSEIDELNKKLQQELRAANSKIDLLQQEISTIESENSKFKNENNLLKQQLSVADSKSKALEHTLSNLSNEDARLKKMDKLTKKDVDPQSSTNSEIDKGLKYVSAQQFQNDEKQRQNEILTQKVRQSPSLAVLINDESRKNFVRNLFQKDSNAYLNFIGILEKAPTWKEAKFLLDAEFKKRKINPYSRYAVQLSDLVFSRYFSNEKNNNETPL